MAAVKASTNLRTKKRGKVPPRLLTLRTKSVSCVQEEDRRMLT